MPLHPECQIKVIRASGSSTCAICRVQYTNVASEERTHLTRNGLRVCLGSIASLGVMVYYLTFYLHTRHFIFLCMLVASTVVLPSLVVFNLWRGPLLEHRVVHRLVLVSDDSN